MGTDRAALATTVVYDKLEACCREEDAMAEHVFQVLLGGQTSFVVITVILFESSCLPCSIMGKRHVSDEKRSGCFGLLD